MSLQSKRRPLVWGCAMSLAWCVACGGDAGSNTADSNSPADGTGADGTGADGTDADGNGSDGSPGDGADESSDGSGADDTPSGDDGGTDGNDGPQIVEGSTAYFRADEMLVIKPNIYEAVAQFVEMTGTVNDALADSIENDELPENAPDGLLDLSVLLKFVDFDANASGLAAMGGALCAAPLGSAPCEPDPTSPFTELPYTAQAEGTCLAFDGVTVSAPCFVNEPQDLTVMFATLGAVPLKGAQVAGRWASDPKNGISTGLLRGFLTESAANATKVPDDIPLAALIINVSPGDPVSKVLKKSEQQEYGGEKGWWFTVQFSASPVSFEE